MHVILDGVFNHMGVNSFAFRDVVLNQHASRFAGWFKIKSWVSPVSGRGCDYGSWRDHPTLPELRQDHTGIVEGPRDYIFAATRRWMAPEGIVEDGVDGWRLDVARWVAHAFWKAWRRLVKSINPQAYLVAEIISTVEFNKAYLQGDEFDAVMNYNFAFACDEFFLREKRRIRVSTFDRLLRPTAGGVSSVCRGRHAEPSRQPRHGKTRFPRGQSRRSGLSRLRRGVPPQCSRAVPTRVTTRASRPLMNGAYKCCSSFCR